MSQIERPIRDESELDQVERDWLDQRLREYRALLDYLRDH